MLRLLALAASLIAALAAAGCATRWTPLEVAPTDLDHWITAPGWRGDHRLSPDGRKFLWIEQGEADFVIVSQAVAGGPLTRIPIGRLAPAGVVFTQVAWLGDSRHIAWVQDDTGDENTQVWVKDTEAPDVPARNLTPWPGARSTIVNTGAAKGSVMRIVSNRRDARVFDLFRVDYATGETAEEARNPGDVLYWITDSATLDLAGRARAEGEAWVIEVLGADGAWRELRRFPDFSGYVRSINRGKKSAILGTRAGRNTRALVRVDLETGEERTLFADERVDVDRSYYSAGPDLIYAVQIEPGYPETRILFPKLHELVSRRLHRAAGAELLGFEILSTDRGLQRFVFRTYTREGTREVFFERKTGEVRVLRDSARHPAGARLVYSEPVEIAARDGRRLHGYLTRPPGPAKGSLPLIVSIHGGPWARDHFMSRDLNPGALAGGNALGQMLAQRGYAVLRINFRGSDGYGLEHVRAAERSLGDRTQDDVEDAVRWAIREGIADPTRIVAAGGSFGGFSVLMQLQRSPDLYRCGINWVGVADWQRQMERQPPYWWSAKGRFYAFYGDPRTPEGAAELKRISPVHALDKIRVPLLVFHGKNDIRVAVEDSEDVAAGLRRLGRPVEYFRFEDEGHSTRSVANRLSTWRAVDAFLKRCVETF